MEDKQTKSLRLLTLYQRFSYKASGYTVRELAKITGAEIRSIQRDILDLQSGIFPLPLVQDGYVWKIDPESHLPLPPIILTREQAVALFIGSRLLSQHSERIAPIAEAAVAKLAQAMPPEVGFFLLQTVPKATTNTDLKSQELTQQIFLTLVNGWIEKLKVSCVHETLKGRSHTYHLAPYIFEPSAVGNAIYVRGQCDEDKPGQLRTLKLDRIRQATLSNESFEVKLKPADLKLENAWRIWDSDEPPVEVRLRFSKRVLERVKETVWHPNQQVFDLEDGGCEWRAMVAEPGEMRPWIRGWGADCEVLAPVELRAELIREARRLAKLYRVETTSNENLSQEERINRTLKNFFGD
jgi:CRISPR-associated endonuclease/helicase Cas3